MNRGIDEANRFNLYEVYLDEDAFVIAHKGSAHFAEFIARSTPLTIPGSKSDVLAHRTAAEKKNNDHAL